MLTHRQRLDLFDATLVPRLRSLLETKGMAYGDEDDAHANYRLAERLLFCSTLRAIFARATDKFVRLGRLLHYRPTETALFDEELEELMVCLVNAWTERRMH